jgi:hypothetical protein
VGGREELKKNHVASTGLATWTGKSLEGSETESGCSGIKTVREDNNEKVACNPSYSGGRDQEDRSLKPVKIVHKTLTSKKKITKRAGRVVQGVDPEFKP